MSRTGKLEQHRHSLSEIREIMSSMKSLAYMETRKLGQCVSAQRTLVAAIEEAATDLLAFHPTILPSAEPTVQVHVVVGTERGFCGELNENLARQVGAERDSQSIVLAVGHKLRTKLEDRSAATHQIVFIDGAGVLEEVSPVLERIVSELESIRSEHGMVGVTATYYRSEAEISEKRLLPPFEASAGSTSRFSHAPCINMHPADLLVELTDHYLLASLHEILYASLMNENQHRVTHLGLSVKHLDRKLADLVHKANALRQEEITEEIEVILLNAVDMTESDQ